MELRIRGVSKTYPNGVRALKDVTLTIPTGMYGLLGPTGRTVVHVYAGAAPGPGSEPAEPDLEDVYFGTMAGHVGRRRGQAVAS